jgi:hypothetical protein
MPKLGGSFAKAASSIDVMEGHLCELAICILSFSPFSPASLLLPLLRQQPSLCLECIVDAIGAPKAQGLKINLNVAEAPTLRKRSGIPSCVTKSVANDAATTPRFHSPASSAGE